MACLAFSSTRLLENFHCFNSLLPLSHCFIASPPHRSVLRYRTAISSPHLSSVLLLPSAVSPSARCATTTTIASLITIDSSRRRLSRRHHCILCAPPPPPVNTCDFSVKVTSLNLEIVRDLARGEGPGEACCWADLLAVAIGFSTLLAVVVGLSALLAVATVGLSDKMARRH